MKILIDAMVVILVYMIGYKMGMNYMNRLLSDKLEEIIHEELERRKLESKNN